MALKEIKPPKPQYGAPGENCPKCGGPTRRSKVPCPHGKLGCLVNHTGFVCVKCGTPYRNV